MRSTKTATRALDRTVTIKILPAALAADPEFRDRFDREARAISQLTHPHICAFYDVGEQTGMAYLVMEYLEGETLEQRVKKGAVPLDDALKIAIQVADALSAAHRRGIAESSAGRCGRPSSGITRSCSTSSDRMATYCGV